MQPSLYNPLGYGIVKLGSQRNHEPWPAAPNRHRLHKSRHAFTNIRAPLLHAAKPVGSNPTHAARAYAGPVTNLANITVSDLLTQIAAKVPAGPWTSARDLASEPHRSFHSTASFAA